MKLLRGETTWFLFFFQAEDGIRDYKVTGVQTCALPISGVACPKSRCPGCNPAAQATESFPGCPPGPPARTAARRASACRQAKMALLTCRFNARRASLGVLPPASFLS